MPGLAELVSWAVTPQTWPDLILVLIYHRRLVESQLILSYFKVSRTAQWLTLSLRKWVSDTQKCLLADIGSELVWFERKKSKKHLPSEYNNCAIIICCLPFFQWVTSWGELGGSEDASGGEQNQLLRQLQLSWQLLHHHHYSGWKWHYFKMSAFTYYKCCLENVVSDFSML